MAEEYSFNAYGTKLAILTEHRKKKKNAIKKALFFSAVIIIVATAVILIAVRFCKKSNALIGTWRYDEHTQYIFEKNGTGKLLADDVPFDYTYSVKGKKLIIDFTEDYIRDCDYTFSVSDNTLTLIGGSGTDGGTYKLRQYNQDTTLF